MIIKEVIGVRKESVLNKEYNLWIGVSLGNKWHSRENLLGLILLGLQYTKESLLIWIPGRMEATNFKYFDNLSRADALKKAFELEDKKLSEIDGIINGLDKKSKEKIVICNFDDTCTPRYIKRREILFREFAKQKLFYEEVMKIAEEFLKSRARSISRERAEAVTLYLIHELPLFLDGVETIHSDVLHNVVLYPGFGKLDELTMSMRNDIKFASLKERLNLQNEIGIADVE